MDFDIGARSSATLSEEDRRAVTGGSNYGNPYELFNNAVRLDKCQRCNKTVYQAEKVDVDRVLFHKGCFRCAECNAQLTITNCVITRQSYNTPKEVYCKAHAPKHTAYSMDSEAIGIKNAVNAQQVSTQQAFNHHIRIRDTHDWEYDPYAMEFTHAKHIYDRNRIRKPPRPEAPLNNGDYETYNDLTLKLLKGEMDRDSVKNIASVLDDNTSTRRLVEEYDYVRPPADMPGQLNANGQQEKSISRSSSYEHTGKMLEQQENNLYEPLQVRAVPSRRGLDENTMRMFRTLTNNDRAKFMMFLKELYGPDFSQSPVMPPPPPPPTGQGDWSTDTRALVENTERHYAAPYGRPFGERLGDQDMLDFGMGKYDMLGNNQPPFLAEMISSQKSQLRPPDQRPPPKQTKSMTLPRATRLPSIPDEKRNDKIFIAQNQLEMKQRAEEDKIFKDFESRRETEIKRLEKEIRSDMEHAVKNVLKEMDRGYFSGDIGKEKARIEDHFNAVKKDRMQDLLNDLSSHERTRLADMIDKQSTEMLGLISSKHSTMVPPPKPPSTKKADLYKNTEVFARVDEQAIQVASCEQNSFTELLYWLTQDCRNEVEKARAIFRWITVKDLNKMLFIGNIDPSSPFFLLRGIKYGIESYHELFKRLCSYAGLHCKVIKGYSKSFGYKPGMALNSDSRFRNQWTVVYVDGNWRFVDCHWGARRVYNHEEEEGAHNCLYEYDEFYFLTDPEDFIYQHYPDDEEWQLMEEPLDMDGFIKMPLLKSHFFQYGLRLRSELDSEVETDNGKVDIVLQCETPERYSFTSRLECEGEILERFAIHHVVDNKIVFNVNIPKRGDHILTLFASDTRDFTGLYNSICVFAIKCSHIEADSKFQFPMMPLGVGPHPAANSYGLKLESHKEPFIEATDEKLIVTLKFDKAVKITHKLVCGNYDYQHEEFDRYAFQRFREASSVSFLLRFPQQGFYAFSVFASPIDSQGSNLDIVYSYLIYCPKTPDNPPKMFPKTHNRWMKCRLHEPPIGDLKLNKNVKFKLEVAGGKKVAVIIKGKWYYLKGPNKNIFEGAVFTGKDLDNVCVFANFDGVDFHPLLEYKLVR